MAFPFQAKTNKNARLFIAGEPPIIVAKGTEITVESERGTIGEVSVTLNGQTKGGTMDKANYDALDALRRAPGEAPVTAQPVAVPVPQPVAMPVPQPVPVPADPSPGKLAWGAKVSDVFRDKVRKIAGDLGCDPNFLMAAMAFETGGTFSPSEKSKAGSGATGLIQFMPNTAIGMGTTTTDLAKMSAEEQLDFVAKFFARQKGKLHTLADVYMAILFPVAVGKPENFVLFTKGTKAYDQNAGLDIDKDGKVTKAEASNLVQKRLDEGMKPGNVG